MAHDLLDRLLAGTGQTRAELQASGSGTLSRILRTEGIEHSPEIDRILKLPRVEQPTDELIDLLSERLRKRPFNDDGEPNRLRPGQVVALRELFERGGMFGPMPCGSGKTLVSLLAATLLGSQRPVLVVPASLRDKTRREFAVYLKDWHVRLPRLVSYQELGGKKGDDLLARLHPDLLIKDEAHFVRNTDAGCTRKIRRYIKAAREADAPCIVADMSGTLITESLMEYHHLIVDSLRDAAPVPLRPVTAERWARALDRDVGVARRIAPGALEQIPGGFHEWLRNTAGVCHVPGSGCDATIEIDWWAPEVPRELRRIIDTVEASGMRPDGELLNDFELPMTLCQLALGFYYVWDPLPPDWWLEPRRAWWAYARDVVAEHIEGFDTEGQIVNALERRPIPVPIYGEPVETHDGWQENIIGYQDHTYTGASPPDARHGLAALREWRAVRDQFEPNTVPVWLDGSICEQIAGAVEPEGWIVWCRHRAVGERLASLGLPWYGGGTNPEAAAGRSIAASVDAHATGKNLQPWHSNLVTAPMADAKLWEQLISRTHREGQTADTIRFRIADVIGYHRDVVRRSKSQARAIARASGFPQKLVDATWL